MRALENRYYNDTWNKLSTTKTSNDSNYTYYSAISPGFSHFAISGKKIVKVTLPSIISPASTTPAPTTPTPTVPPVTPTPSTSLAKMGIALVLIIAIVAGVHVFLRKKEA